MKPSTVLPIVSALVGGVASQGLCATEDPTPETLALLGKLQQRERRGTLVRRQSAAANLTVPVHMHAVVSEGQDERIPEAQLQQQFQVLVDSFAPSNIHLVLEGQTRTVDGELARGPLGQGAGFQEFVRTTRAGGYGTLNVYFYTDMDPGVSGICNLPSIGGGEDPFIWNDPCHILAATMPGDGAEGVQGKTAVHEVGHWFGLLHTFHGSTCNPLGGDMVDDTPPESVATTGCPVGKDSCPEQPGLDPIHNYMDYSSDPCLTEFTPGQTFRMHDTFAWTRASS
ncbi:hypothetical protein VD0002_g3509 [Verticillium dahliae]|uniref:Metalloprotease n=2 Tax=Verticillium dahliae TaxID=27337 RepID=G2XGG5_VERDV|nr:metalloprotease [Verticillium dahliae VdLs.17]KAF3346899.1 hypothetical protein VdG2_04641 [Verticillium dahliae VDG2]KAH6692922.1 metalloprotease [Verticillium dahliae]EGY18913.1 metalloprotease [Verticillium dahliae VdLs.17]PNH30594.1 hypothetical protein BJF96_g6172 [Verticillium dahliae]PNH52533.1 hypothetical protein VD0003_g4797 [Verticillium dahliae]